jgi:NodT family efflux transporter outer membrane factor (OMF) lipoprotein
MPRRVSLYVVLVLVGGCASLPQEQIDQIPQPLSLQNSVDQALASSAFEAGCWPTEAWWESFHDPQLSKLILEGIENSPNLKKAEARVRESLNIADQIKSRFLPYIKAFGSDNWEHLSKHGFEREFAFHAPTHETRPAALQNINWTDFAVPVPAVLQVLDLGFDMNWQLDFFGKNKLRLAAALGIAKANEAEARATRLQVSSQIAQSYFSFQSHWAILEIYRELVALRKKLDFLAEKRAEIGLNTKIQTIASQINISAAEKLVYDLEETVVLNKHRLLVLMGANPDADYPLNACFSPLESPIPIPEEISSNLLVHRPDLMASIWRVEKAASEVGVAKLEFFPEINLKGLLSFRSVVPEDLFSLSSVATSLLPSFKLPIFYGGELRANLREKIALFEEAVYSYKETLLNALQNVSDQLTSLESLRKQIDSQQSIYQGAQDQHNLAQVQCSVGVINSLKVMDWELETLNQKINLLTLQSNQIVSTVKLMQALGGGYNSPLAIPEKFIQVNNNDH